MNGGIATKEFYSSKKVTRCGTQLDDHWFVGVMLILLC